MSQAQIQRDRAIVPSGSPPVQPAPWGGGPVGPSSDPQYVMSPQAPATGHKTTGLTFMVACDTVTTVTVWKRDPHTLLWGIQSVFTSAAPSPIGPFVWASICGLLASELWFETDAASSIGHPDPMILLEETSG